MGMPYLVKATDEVHLAVLLRIIEDHDSYADDVDLPSCSFRLVKIRYWLWVDLNKENAVIEPPYIP